ncbi:MAG TPA: DUF6448 family protein [Candidatus Krumholzibacteria bacterium]
MERIERIARWAGCLLAVVFLVIAPRVASAHCDTMNGPVVQDAREALAKGDVTPVLKWVGAGFEGEVKNAFATALAVHKQGGEAGELADRTFFETLVRIHREGEGAAYTGLKDEPVDPVIQMAEDALGTGSADDMIQKLKAHMESVVREKFTAVQETSKQKDKSVELGRTYVAAYVTYMHYLEGLHASIVSPGDHHHDAGAAGEGEHK